MWSDLPLTWQICFKEGWQAFLDGSLPIGAVVLDAEGGLISKGHSQIHRGVERAAGLRGTPLAHAELNALIAMFEHAVDPHKMVLYTLLEPCPLCMGAIYMAGVRSVWFAARDAYAGSADLLGKTEYLSRKPVKVLHHVDEELELVVTAMHTAALTMAMQAKARQVLDVQRRSMPQAVAFGQYLVEEKWLQRMLDKKDEPKAVYENILFLFTEKFLKTEKPR
jgi:tRNA(adenine34) deaminase